MFAGDTRDIVVSVVDQDGVKVNLGTASVIWKMAKSDWKTNTSAVLITKNSSAGQIGLADGSFTVHLASADTMTLEGTYYHEAQITLADGTIGTPLTGKVKIKQNVIDPH